MARFFHGLLRFSLLGLPTRAQAADSADPVPQVDRNACATAQ